MTLVSTTKPTRRSACVGLLLATLGVLGLATGCLTGDTTAPTGPAFKITSDLKDSSAYPAGTILTVPVRVTVAGVAAGLAAVHWTLLVGHGALSDSVTTTDTLGAAHVLWTIGSTPEQNALVIVVGDAVDTLRATGIVGSPSYLDLVGARSDTAAVGTSVTLGVIVRDHSGNAVPGATVSWSSVGGSLSKPSAVSDGTGTATEGFAASAAGTYQVTADLAGLASQFFEVVVH
jgi:hypothetical protein